jgi:hypothetical protein
MSPMTAQRVAIMLEMVSFFFVTLDLYGEARLEKLDKTIKIYIDRIRQIPIAEILFRYLSAPFFQIGQILTNRSSFSYGPRGYIQYGILLLYLALINSIFKINTGSNIVDLFLLLLVAGIFVPFFLLTVSIVLVLVVFVIELPFDILMNFSRFLLYRLNLNGSLVVIGTIMFVISKFVSLLYT